MAEPDLDAIVFGLRLAADDAAIVAMILAIAAVVSRYSGGRDSASSVRDALAAVAGAKGQHEASEMLEGASPVRLVNVLRRTAANPEQAADYLARTDPAISATAYSHLWDAAVQLGYLRFETVGGAANAGPGRARLAARAPRQPLS